MGFREVIHGCSEGGYQRLRIENEDTANPGSHSRRKVNGEVVVLGMSSSKGLRFRCFPSVSLARRVVDFYGEVASSMKLDNAVSPTILFSSQWGLPVLSHSSSVASKRVIYLHRSSNSSKLNRQ